MEDVFEINRRNWEDRVAIHLRDTTGSYNIAGFLAGEDTLTPIEAAEIGDVRGKRLLHLQCHFGLDTLSLARRGAVVTGLDFSPTAIAGAHPALAFPRPSLRATSTTPLLLRLGRSTSSSRPGARSTGCRTSGAGPK